VTSVEPCVGALYGRDQSLSRLSFLIDAYQNASSYSTRLLDLTAALQRKYGSSHHLFIFYLCL